MRTIMFFLIFYILFPETINQEIQRCIIVGPKKGFVKESGTGGLPAWTKLAQKFIKLQLTFYSSVE